MMSRAAAAQLDDRDQRLVRELVSGVTRWRRRLDYVISELTGRSAADLEPAMRQVLRLGAYELWELDAPAHALNEHVELAKAWVLRLGAYELWELDAPAHALNEHVELAKAWVRPAAAGFANGVLREAARRRDGDAFPDPAAKPPAGSSTRELARHLSLVHSHPPWLVARWLARLGREGAEALMESNNARPTYSLRANLAPLLEEEQGGSSSSSSASSSESSSGGSAASLLLQRLGDVDGAAVAPSPLLPSDFVRVQSGLQSVLRAGLVQSGACAVQDESTGLVVQLLDPQAGGTLLDVCAAPGNKTLMAAGRMGAKGRVLALDVSEARLQALRRAAALQRPPARVQTAAADAADAEAVKAAVAAAGFRPAFDRVLLDAPCSGTGVLAKRADLRWRRTPEQLADLVTLQDRLLDAAAAFVKPGGLLVYSTCSIEDEECVERVRAFLARAAGRGFALEAPPPGLLPDQVVGADGCLRTLPHVHGVDGAFAARLRRAGGA